MTVSYYEQLATAKGLTLIKLLLLKWRGSLLKLLWRDLLIFLSLYAILQLVYQLALDHEQQKVFEAIVQYTKSYQDLSTLSFILGFFVSKVFGRWWEQWNSVPWPTSLAVYVSSTLHGFDEVGRAMRRTIMRYTVLSLTMIFRALSPRVVKRFPRMDDMVSAGLINEDELAVLSDLDKKFPGYGKYWLPICWAAAIATRAREDGRIKDDFALKTIMEELTNFRGKLGTLSCYSSICIPLVYVQVVVIAVYTFFLTSLLSHQYIKTHDDDTRPTIHLDYLPILISLQFIFYMGWLKVAETMINPFGNDDDDFELNYLIDRNLQMSYLIVDEMHHEHPELLKDQYWNQIPHELPDKSREKDKDRKVINVADIFDVDDNNRKSVPKITRRTTANVFINVNDDEPGVNISNLSRESLIPRPDIIDKTYHRLSNVQESQSTLERQMENVKSKDSLSSKSNNSKV